jgi:hypothetical protein
MVRHFVKYWGIRRRGQRDPGEKRRKEKLHLRPCFHYCFTFPKELNLRVIK